jgi:hypothetical protein
MKVRFYAVLVLLAAALAGCSHELASCKGDALIALNPGRWQPLQADLAPQSQEATR